METLDWAVVGVYFAVLLGLAWWVIRQSKNTTDDYFLAGRNLGWFIVGASIFASNIGSEHLVGLAGSGCTDGVAMAHYELHAWCLLVLGWVLVPFYSRSMVYTMPEFLEKRYSPTARWVLSVISLVAYVLTKIAVGIFAGGIVFATLLPELKLTVGSVVLDSFWIGSVAVIVLTGLYTILGGLRAVAYTEALQTVILVFGSLLVTIFGLRALGGWDQLRDICGSDMFNLWKPLVPEGVEGSWAPVLEENAAGEIVKQAWYFNGDFPWLGMLFCAPIIGLWYWCTDQYIVQRTLGAPNEQQARRGTIFAAMLKLLPVFIFIIPGMICFALASTAGGDVAAAGNASVADVAASATVAEGGPAEALRAELYTDDGILDGQKCQAAFPLMVQHVLPAGIRGIVVAGLLSALTGVFNASSTLFTMDLYGKFRPNVSQQKLVWVGRVATGVMVVIGLAWVPVIRGAEGLYGYLQSVQGYLAPPIFVVFFLGVFMKRLNAKGCLATLGVGFAMGMFRLAVDTPISLHLGGLEAYEHGSFLWVINNIYFQYYSLLVFVVSVVVAIGVSYMTAAPSAEQIAGLTFATTSDADRSKSRGSWDARDVVMSAMVLVAILAAYLYFNG